MIRASFVTSGLVLAATVAGAADRIPDDLAPTTEIAGSAETYGTGSLTIYTIPSANFTARQSANAYQTVLGIERFLPGGGSFDAAPMLPNGAQIERLELRACDSNAAAEVNVFLGVCPTPGMGCALPGSVSTGVAATPGCNNFSTTLASPIIVNNQTTPIVLEVTTGTAANTTFSAVKLYYRLRVSPAPAVASFGDVATSHPQFRFVEALAAAGITGGCGGGNYCPDAPLTRGQMAVFLSTALGLHFPN